jgi:hypothetical protein
MMPLVKQVLGFALLLLGIGIALWVSFWLLLVLFCVGAVMVIGSHLRDYLLKKGILNPTPGVPPAPPGEENAPVIDGDFTRIESKAISENP